ncbi:phosphomevalonate kinase [Virgibacillus sp. YIM 98842]|uniref:phosphomevalonate kinase n=1 Tax=Virgibacillus sp. YIM 98842 TaxID=2663533 RepID=UPI0013DCFCD7|nr:phosphomevalonate kinase [Virgibacillus sp. YIM 98842]
MSNSSITIKVPGKLMVAGEFAVLEPHHQLVVMAVDRFVYTTIEQNRTNVLSLHDFQLEDMSWEFRNNEVEIASDDKRLKFVQHAMKITLAYLRERSIIPGPFKLGIKSELDDASGAKYGLGSSAAVVTSVVSAILKKFASEETDKELLFKLASIAHVTVQGNGSGADIAASSFGGFLEYTSFQAEWLLDLYHNSASITEMLKTDWIYYTSKAIQPPENVYVCIGWTGKPASTGKLVHEVLKLKDANPEQFRQFLNASEEAVDLFLAGMREKDLPRLLKGVKQNRAALKTVGKHASVNIETPLLSKLCDTAEQFGGAGKPSGAGGGDCGIAFMPTKESAEAVMEAWKQEGIKPLTIKPYRGKSPLR